MEDVRAELEGALRRDADAIEHAGVEVIDWRASDVRAGAGRAPILLHDVFLLDSSGFSSLRSILY